MMKCKHMNNHKCMFHACVCTHAYLLSEPCHGDWACECMYVCVCVCVCVCVYIYIYTHTHKHVSSLYHLWRISTILTALSVSQLSRNKCIFLSSSLSFPKYHLFRAVNCISSVFMITSQMQSERRCSSIKKCLCPLHNDIRTKFSGIGCCF